MRHISGRDATLPGHPNLIILTFIHRRSSRGRGWFGNNHHCIILVVVWHQESRRTCTRTRRTGLLLFDSLFNLDCFDDMATAATISVARHVIIRVRDQDG
jgi:hypothetical protein